MIDGLVVVDKPQGFTSHDVVAKMRKKFQQKRVGHSGTLDPDATGVLLVGLGRATRLMRFLNDLPKVYEGVFQLGVATSTLDASGEVTKVVDMSQVTSEEVAAATEKFIGDIQQIPPMVSAVQVDGKRLYELAREGKEVERKPRAVHVYEFSVNPTDKPDRFVYEVKCSSGTYVRTLIADLGESLGGVAHVRTLRRTSIGEFESPTPIDEVSDESVLPPLSCVSHLPVVELNDAGATAVGHGKALPLATPVGDVAVVDKNQNLLAVCVSDGAVLKPDVVLV